MSDSGSSTGKGGRKSLTVSQIRRELQLRGVPLPPSNSRKEIYVQLYDQHVAPFRNSRAPEFSSDDDVEITTGIRRSVSPSEDVALLSAHSDIIDTVERMTDEELYQELLRRRQTIGPVVDSTRNMYKKKLKRVMVKEFKKSRGDSSSESEVENAHGEVSSSRAYVNGSSASTSSTSRGRSSSTRSTSGSVGPSELLETSLLSFGNGFSSGDSDIDNVPTFEDYVRQTTPKPSKLAPKAPAPTATPRKGMSSPRAQIEKNPTTSFRTTASTPGRRITTGSSTGISSSGYENFASSTSTSRVEQHRTHRLTTGGIAGGLQREWNQPLYEVREVEKSRHGIASSVEDETQNNGSNGWKVLLGAILIVVLAVLIYGYFFSGEKEMTEDEAIDQQIEETLKLMVKNPGDDFN